MSPSRSRSRRLGYSLAGLLTLGGCEVGEYLTANRAPELLVGLAANDLRLCAGLPDRTAFGAGGTEFWSYERAVSVGSGNFSMPQIGVSLSGGEECRATFELWRGRVARVAFTRMAGTPTIRSASCAPLVQTCVELVQAGQLTRALPAR
ncbi:hypothetical protein [Falsiroseomonas sp.]|uniref:hypothetical protein n=1 Tax=Falsiroseomonas sp. TaxID=2870721 RepID=UPI0035694B46